MVKYKQKILSVIDDFIVYNNDFRESHGIKNYKESFEFYHKKIKKDWLIVVQYYYGEYKYKKRQYEVTFTKDEFDKLKLFMENTDLYKNSKKYNL